MFTICIITLFVVAIFTSTTIQLHTLNVSPCTVNYFVCSFRMILLISRLNEGGYSDRSVLSIACTTSINFISLHGAFRILIGL